MESRRKSSLPVAHLLFMTWLVLGGGLVTGLPPAFSIGIAAVLSLLLSLDVCRPRCVRRPEARSYEIKGPGWDELGLDLGEDLPESGRLAWIGRYLKTLRLMR